MTNGCLASLGCGTLPAHLRHVACTDWHTPVIEYGDLPLDSVDWTTKRKLEDLGLLNWWTHVAICPLFPLNHNVESDNNFNILCKRNLNEILQFFNEMITMVMERGHCGNKIQTNFSTNSAATIEKEKGLQQTPTTEMSVLLLANILRRPIIVMGEPSVTNQVQGIYLPTMETSSECRKSPLVIAHSLGEFMPLVCVTTGKSKHKPSMESHAGCEDEFIAAVPVVTKDMNLLSTKTTNNINIVPSLISRTCGHLNLTEVGCSGCKRSIPAAKLCKDYSCYHSKNNEMGRLRGEDFLQKSGYFTYGGQYSNDVDDEHRSATGSAREKLLWSNRSYQTEQAVSTVPDYLPVVKVTEIKGSGTAITLRQCISEGCHNRIDTDRNPQLPLCESCYRRQADKPNGKIKIRLANHLFANGHATLPPCPQPFRVIKLS